jgi:predicted acetyltransferase
MLCRAFGWDPGGFERFAAGGPLERVLVAFEGDAPVACSRIREFGQFFGGRRVPMGGFSPVGVATEFRGQGLGSRITAAQFPLMRERGEVLSGLYPATNALYRRVGFEIAGVWAEHRTRTRELQNLPLGRGTATRRASDDDRGAIERCYRRVAPTIPGFLDRNQNWWDRIFSGESQQIYVVDAVDGDIAGYVRYTLRWPERASVARIEIAELVADEPEVTHALWRLVGSSSSIAPECSIVGPPEHPLLLSMSEQDLISSGAWRWMARIIDAPGAIASRGYVPGTKLAVALRLDDPQCEWNAGRWRVVVEDGEGYLERGGDGDVQLGIGAFSALYTGYASPWQLLAAGLLRADGSDSLAALGAAFAGPSPWMPDFY